TRLGIENSAVASASDYVPSGKKDFIFFIEPKYDESVEAMLKKYPDLTGVILVGLKSEFETDIPNLVIMRRPESTMSMIRILNEQYDEVRRVDENKTFKIDFTAPDAHILAVDDNEINLTIIEGLLSSLNVKLDKADGGRKAIEMAAENDYDIILMDHMMPEIDGVDATRAIRTSVGRADHPVIIAVSANVMEEARRLFAEAGMNDFVAKPVDVKDLVTAVRKWLPADKIVSGEAIDVSDTAASDQGFEIRVKSETLDIDRAVEVLGSAELYDRITEEYYLSGADKLNNIKEAYTKEDWKDYTIKVHSLKSSSRQIGAMELGDMAEALEKAGNALDIDTIRSDTDKVLKAYEDLLGELSIYYAPSAEETGDKPLITEQRLNELMDELVSACDDLDMDAMERVSDDLKEYSYEDDLRGLIEDLTKAVRDIDTEKCTEIIAKISGEA
ncbi:MAG: response regulator, partial [Lachnospiraceae bacterium]|nr:response regulator [Lachnospiraceae bacterium]